MTKFTLTLLCIAFSYISCVYDTSVKIGKMSNGSNRNLLVLIYHPGLNPKYNVQDVRQLTAKANSLTTLFLPSIPRYQDTEIWRFRLIDLSQMTLYYDSIKKGYNPKLKENEMIEISTLDSMSFTHRQIASKNIMLSYH
jgi:hypothetical protein